VLQHHHHDYHKYIWVVLTLTPFKMCCAAFVGSQSFCYNSPTFVLDRLIEWTARIAQFYKPSSSANGEKQQWENGGSPPRNDAPALRRLLVVLGTLALTVPAILHVRAGFATREAAGCPKDSRSGVYTVPQTLVTFKGGAVRCGKEPKADVDWIQGAEGQAGGDHTYVGYNSVCLDQEAVIMHHERYNMLNGSELPTFDVTDIQARLHNHCFMIYL
jgi:hypothetical protein